MAKIRHKMTLSLSLVVLSLSVMGIQTSCGASDTASHDLHVSLIKISKSPAKPHLKASKKQALVSSSVAKSTLQAHGKDKKLLLKALYSQLKLAKNSSNAEQIVKAIETLWLRSGNKTVDYMMLKALLLSEQGEHDAALEVLNGVVKIAPKYAEGWHRRALVYAAKQDLFHAMGDLRKVLRLNPLHFNAINHMAIILQENGHKQMALKAYRKLLEIHPHYAGARQSLGELARDVEGQET